MYDYDVMVCRDPYEAPAGTLICSAPGFDVDDAVRTLEVIGTGGDVGAGARIAWLGESVPRIRAEYKAELEQFIVELEQRRAQLLPRDIDAAHDLARWAVEQRRQIARKLRVKQGMSATVVLEIRDHAKYGWGGRSYPNMLRRDRSSGWRASHLGINDAALRGARFLKNGGRVVLVVSLATTAAALLTASEEELPRVSYAAGGAVGSGLAVAGCLVLGITTGGWGLLACGVVAGLGGGDVGQKAGERLYYLGQATKLSDGFVFGAEDLASEPVMPAQLIRTLPP
jgi:hypothetical protein